MLVKLVILLVTGVAGVGLVGVAVRALLLARASRSWVVVPGVVSSTRLQTWGLYGFSRINYGVLVDYDYWVEGYRYSGRRRHFTIWRFGGMSLDEAIRLTKERYDHGAPVAVHVDPRRPGEAVLEARADGLAVATCLAIGALFLAAEAAFVLDLVGVVAL